MEAASGTAGAAPYGRCGAGSYRSLCSQAARELVDNVDAFLFDCDGVIWKGEKLIEGVAEALQALRSMIGPKALTGFLPMNVTRHADVNLKKATPYSVTFRSRRRCMSRSQPQTAHNLGRPDRAEHALFAPGDELMRGFRAIWCLVVVFGALSPVRGALASAVLAERDVHVVRRVVYEADDIDDLPYDHDIAYGLYDNISLCDDALQEEEVDPKELPQQARTMQEDDYDDDDEEEEEKEEEEEEEEEIETEASDELEVDQLEDAEVHASFMGIAFLLLLRLLPPVVHASFRGIAFLLLLRLLPSEIYILHKFYS
ncbi:hypothetical protein Taro_037103 [Colocasia esculenta]|uniref:Uncharacterized protein n=1 Tax=Colocasia esculenta TaxID=4460 RepID=A0A843WF99_COLES|nr:hypothetical protein [Colocasia esculenta]